MTSIVSNKTKSSEESSKLIKNSPKNEDIYLIYNYSIDFYNSVFIKGIHSINKNNVRTNFIEINESKYTKNGKINNEKKEKEENKIIEDKEKQKERIVNDYLIPLSYLIYSYIYQKFYIVQQRKDIIMENKLNYKMYQYFFSHKNPIIKKVNVYFYNLYNNLLPNNNKNSTNKVNSNGDIKLPKEIEQYVIPEIRKGNTKNDLIAFLDKVNNKVKTEEDMTAELILQDLNKLESKTNDINEIFKNIVTKFQKTYNDAVESYNKKKDEYDKLLENDKKIINIKISDIEELKVLEKEKEKKNIKGEIDNLNSEKKKLEDTLSRYKDNKIESKTAISKKIEILKRKLGDYKSELIKNNNKKREFDAEITKEELKCKILKNNSKTQCEKKIEEITNKRNEIIIKIDEIEKNINNIEEEIKQKQDEKNSLNNNATTKRETTEISKKINNINDEIKTKTSELNEIKNNYINKYEELKKKQNNLKKLKSTMENFNKDMIISEKENEIIKKIVDKIDNTTNIYQIINELKFNKIQDYKIYLKYKNDYDIIITKYKDLCNIIKLINKNILKINIEKKELIKEDEISIDKIKSIKDSYTEINNKYKENNRIYNIILNKNKEINADFEDEKELIKILFNSLLNKDNNNKNIKNYFNEIIDTKLNIINNIINIINEFTSVNINVFDKNNFKNIYNNIKKDIDDKSFKKPLFQNLYYIYKSIIYEEIIEYDYLLNIISNVTNINEDKYIKIDNNIFKTIKELKYKYNSFYRKFKKENNKSNIVKIDLIPYKKIYNEKKNRYQDTISSLTEKLNDPKYSQILSKNSGLIENDESYTKRKQRKYDVDQLLNELEIKKGNKNTYKTSALSLMKDLKNKEKIEALIKTFITDKSTTIKTTTNKGMTTEKTIPPNNNIVKKKIYNLVKNYYQKNINVNIEKLKKKENDIEFKKYTLEFEKADFTNEKDLLSIYSNNYSEYITEIDNIINSTDSKKIENDNNNRKLNNILSDEFNKLIELSEKIEKIDNIYQFNNRDNKIYFYIESDEIFGIFSDSKEEINKEIKQAIKNENKIKNIKNVKNNIKNNIKKQLKLNSITSDNEKIKIILKYQYFKQYKNFLNKYFNEQKFVFINEIENIYKNLKDNNEIKPFFEEYMNHFKNFSLKINNLLNKINQDIITFNIGKINNLSPYFEITEKKLSYIKTIKTNSEKEINNNKGNFITILPYTDSMFLYIIYLTLVIDYLTFFYE